MNLHSYMDRPVRNDENPRFRLAWQYATTPVSQRYLQIYRQPPLISMINTISGYVSA